MTLPDNTSWSFTYDTYGDVSTVAMPLGGSISYQWATVPLPVCTAGPGYGPTPVSRAVTARTVFDGTNYFTWHYGWGTPQSDGSLTNTVTDPLGNDTVHVFKPVAYQCAMYETSTLYYEGSASSGQLLKRVDTTYIGVAAASDGIGEVAQGVVPVSIQTTLSNGEVGLVQKTYDGTSSASGYGDVLTEKDYDYGPGGPGPLLREIDRNYVWQTGSSYLSANFLDLSSSVITKDSSGNRLAETDYGYDDPARLFSSGVTQQHGAAPNPVRGNLTSVSRWLNTGSPAVSYTNWYDTGEFYQAIDPLGNKTTYTYSPNFYGAYVTQTNLPDTSGVHHVISGNYDFNSGLLTSFTDQNNQTTSYAYDFMWRMTGASFPDGGQTTFSYPNPTTIERLKKITSTVSDDSYTYFNGLGLAIQTKHITPSGNVYVNTAYDAYGRVATVTNPFYQTTDPTYGVTTHSYDNLGRTTSVKQPDGGVISTNYSGNCTTVTDEQGKSRESCTDSLGRIVKVLENPAGLNYETDYGYDALGNLISVVQSASRRRSFVYDSLSRLTQAVNPESGTINYTYDADGNLIYKTGPAPNQTGTATVTVSYCYDALNRMTAKGYTSQTCTNGTMPSPADTYSYDQTSANGLTITNGIGRRTSMTDPAGSEAWSFDSMGRVLTDQRATNGVTKSTLYSYLPYLDGSLNTLTYPSGLQITYSYDGAERPISAVDQYGVKYATGATYAPQGALATATIGQTSGSNGLNLSDSYNDRLQPVEIKASSSAGTAMDLNYNFSVGAGDNGNVMGITNNLDSTRSQAFSYDALNRLSGAWTSSTYSASPSHCWGESYSIDPWGNLLSIGGKSTAYSGCVQESLSITVSTTNQVTGLPFSYDAAGNTTHDAMNSYTWNAENEMISVNDTTVYTYDGDGMRIEKAASGNPPTPYKLYWYGPGGAVLDESDGSGTITNEYVYFGGRRVAHRQGSGSGAALYWMLEDHLGTSRVVTTSSGTVCYDADFYPFGGERVVTNTCSQNYKFEGKERDTETGNDDFGARDYSSSFGRFLSADWSAIPVPVPYANLTNPQTLNLYAMVRDNPETFSDLDGHGAVDEASTTPPSTSPPQKQEPEPPPPQQNTGWSLSWQMSASANFLGQELMGVADATVLPVVNAVEHPVDTVEGIAHAVEHPVDTAEKVVNGAVDTAKAAASGDPRAIGQVAGAVIATAAGAKGAQAAAEEAQGLRGVINRVTAGPREGKLQHIGIVNNKGNIIHLGREGTGWHIGIGRGGGASGAGAAFHIPLPSWLGNLLKN